MKAPKTDGQSYIGEQGTPRFTWYEPPYSIKSRYEIEIDRFIYWKPSSIRKLIKWLEWCLKEIEKK